MWFGFAVEKHFHWAQLAIYGARMVTSITYVYVTLRYLLSIPSPHIRLVVFGSCRFSFVVDSYPKLAKEVVTIMNMFRVLPSFVALFYNQRLNRAVGYSLTFGIEATITGVFGLGDLGVLVVVGGKLR